MTGVRFDRTINLGHILTFLGFIGTMLVGYNAMDKRLTIIEEVQRQQPSRDRAQDDQRREMADDLKQSTAEIRHGIEKLNDKLDRFREMKGLDRGR